jgi:hypothetical protein
MVDASTTRGSVKLPTHGKSEGAYFMNGRRNRNSRSFVCGTVTALLCLAGAGGQLLAQNVNSPSAPVLVGTTADATAVNAPMPAPAVATAPAATATKVDSTLKQVGCSSCSSGLLGPDLSVLPTFSGTCGSCDSGCCGGGCVPGKTPCDCCFDESTCVGRFLGGFYHCICCPDPCYDPHWNPLADAAFFQDGPRPVTQMRLRYESVWDYTFPDKAEYLWAQEGVKGPKAPPGVKGERAVSYQDLSLYSEVAVDRFSASIAIPYLDMEDDTFAGASGFGDLTIGTKSLLLDCELMQFAIVFNTTVPTGNFLKGLGTGHVTLQPGALMALKLTTMTYLQSGLLYSIPIGGDQGFEGPVLQYHLSLNQMLWNCGNGIKLIGVAELNGYEFLGGAATAPDGTILSAKDIGSVVSIGPGVRLVLCDKIDFGVGSAFNLTQDTVGDEIIRVDFRWRF